MQLKTNRLRTLFLFIIFSFTKKNSLYLIQWWWYCTCTFVHPRAVRKPHREKSFFYEWIIRLSYAVIGYEWITLLRIKLLHKEVRSKRSTCASVGMNRVCVESESAAFSHHMFTNLWMNSLTRGTIVGCVELYH